MLALVGEAFQGRMNPTAAVMSSASSVPLGSRKESLRPAPCQLFWQDANGIQRYWVDLSGRLWSFC